MAAIAPRRRFSCSRSQQRTCRSHDLRVSCVVALRSGHVRNGSSVTAASNGQSSDARQGQALPMPRPARRKLTSSIAGHGPGSAAQHRWPPTCDAADRDLPDRLTAELHAVAEDPTSSWRGRLAMPWTW